MPAPRTAFVWPVYADATLAGLSVLIPVPLLDGIFENFFRNRIPTTIASHYDQKLKPEVIAELNQSDDGCLKTCLLLPFVAFIELLKSLSRKLLYFLTINLASERMSHHWQRAFLVDYMLVCGHLDQLESARIARAAMDELLRNARNPLLGLARQIPRGTQHVWRTLRAARRGKEDEVIERKRSQIAQMWGEFETYFVWLAGEYDRVYQVIAERAAAPSTPAADASDPQAKQNPPSI